MNRRIFVLGATWALIAGILFAACGPAATPEKIVVKETQVVTVKETQVVQVVVTPTPETFRKGGTLVVAVNSAPSIFDPADHRDRITETIARQWADPLIAYWHDNKRYMMLAESIKQIEPKVWEIKLKKGVTFHNGDPFTAADVKFTFERGAFQFGGKFCRDSLQRRETEPASVQIQSP